MNSDETGELELSLTKSSDGPNIPINVLRLIVCVIGILGNLLVIFVILVLAEYRKSVTHWYVLQLAIADTVFLLSLPFRFVEDMENGWNFPEWMCKAKETILFLNYYSSIMFLVVMSIDRYIAVCHSFSSFLQKLRTTFAAAVITITVWVMCLLICIPIMMYSTIRGHRPNCRCEYEFPKPFNATETCLKEGEVNATRLMQCISDLSSIPEEACTNATSLNLEFDASGFDYYNVWETTATPDEAPVETVEKTFLQAGCHYYNFADGFRAFILFNFIAMFLVPLLVMAVCYFLIIMRLHATKFRSDDSVNSDSKGSRPASVSSGGRKRTRSASSAKHNKNRLRVTVMCALMVILFFVCWLPFHGVHLAKFVGIQGSTQYCKDLFYTVALVAFINSAINPYLYNFIGTRFGKRLSSAASSVRKSVKKRTTSWSGTVQYQQRRGTEKGTSNSQTATVMTRIYKDKGASEVTSGEMSSNVFKQNDEEQQHPLNSAPEPAAEDGGQTSA